MGLGVERLGGPVGVDGVDSLGREEVEMFTLGRLGGGAVLLDVRESDVRADGRLTPFCVGPATSVIMSWHSPCPFQMRCRAQAVFTFLIPNQIPRSLSKVMPLAAKRLAHVMGL